MDEMFDLKKERIEKQLESHKEVFALCGQLQKALNKLYRLSATEGTCRGVRDSWWFSICQKYDERDLLNCNGDVLFIEKGVVVNGCKVGRRVLWNLELSKERYAITETEERDSDGEYAWTEYDVEVI